MQIPRGPLIFKHRYLQVNTAFSVLGTLSSLQEFFFLCKPQVQLSVTWGMSFNMPNESLRAKQFVWWNVSLPAWSTLSLPRVHGHLWKKETSEDIRIAPPPQTEGLCHPRVNLRDFVKAWWCDTSCLSGKALCEHLQGTIYSCSSKL